MMAASQAPIPLAPPRQDQEDTTMGGVSLPPVVEEEEPVQSATGVSPAVQEALDRIDIVEYTAEDLEGISSPVEPEVDLVTLSLVDAGPLSQRDVDTIAARLRSDTEPPVEYVRIEQSNMAGTHICQTIWDALSDAPVLKVFSATSCSFYEEETVVHLFDKLGQCDSIQDVYFRDVGQYLPESTVQLSRSIARFLKCKSESLRLLSLACNEHVEIDLDLEQGLRSMPHRSNLQHFNMWMNSLGDERIRPIVNVLTLPGWKLRSVDLSENNLTAALLPDITNLMNTCRNTLRLLRLSDNPRLMAPDKTKPCDVRNFLQTFRECRSMQSFSIDQCNVNGPLALSVFESCLTHGTSKFHVPLRQICMQNNPLIGQEYWRRIIRDVIPRLATLKSLFASDFDYEPEMRMSFFRNMVLEHVEPQWFTSRSGLDRAVNDILERNILRNRRCRQVQHLLRRPVSRGIQSAAVRRLMHDGVSGKAGLFMMLSRLVETTHDKARQEEDTSSDENTARLYEQVSEISSDGTASAAANPDMEERVLGARPRKRLRQGN